MTYRFIFLFFFFGISSLWSQSAEEIANQMDSATRFDSLRMEGEIVSEEGGKVRRYSLIIHSKGAVDTLIEFTSGRERGQRVLRTKNEIYLYYPDARQTIRLKGAALRQSLFGSDVSYEDLTTVKATNEDYQVRLLGTEEINGKSAYKLELEARKNDKAYPKQIIWVDQKTYFPLAAEYYSRRGVLLKTLDAVDTQRVDGRDVFRSMTFSDKLKKETFTHVRFSDVSLTPFGQEMFSLRELEW